MLRQFRRRELSTVERPVTHSDGSLCCLKYRALGQRPCHPHPQISDLGTQGVPEERAKQGRKRVLWSRLATYPKVMPSRQRVHWVREQRYL